MGWSLRIPEAGPMAARVGRIDDILDRNIVDELETVGLQGERVMKGQIEAVDAVDRAQMVRSVTSEMKATSGPVQSVQIGIQRGPATAYAGVVDKGRRPGAAMPPVQAIAAWIKRKGGNPRYAFPAAKNIGRRGIRARPILKPSLEQMRAPFRAAMLAALRTSARQLFGGGR